MPLELIVVIVCSVVICVVVGNVVVVGAGIIGIKFRPGLSAFPFLGGIRSVCRTRFVMCCLPPNCRICHQCVTLLMCVSFFDFQCVCQVLYILRDSGVTNLG
jgi:hypothetical protein